MSKENPKKTNIQKILGGICCFFAIGGTVGILSNSSTEPLAIQICIAVFFYVAAILLFTSDRRKHRAYEKQKQYQNKLKSCTMKHVNGLPIAENVECRIISTDDKFIFTSGSMNFELDKSKITDICIKTDTEIQQQYVSSLGSAIGGAVLFGTLGAIIGGRAKKKTVKNEVHNYLIITYKSAGIKYIGFEAGTSLASAYTYVNEFKNTRVEKSTYQL